MAVFFFAVDPHFVDGTDLSLVPHSFPHSSSDSDSCIVIWRLVATDDTNPPQGLYLPIDKAQVVQALSVLFPQLSTSCTAGPNLERIEACLAQSDTFTLFLATETVATTTQSRLNVDDKIVPAVVPKITLRITKIVGCLTLITLKLLMNSRAHIEDLVVASDCRGRGVGRGLMKRAIKEAIDIRGCTMVDLTSKPDRIQARALYESLGFQIRDTGAFRYYAS
ncbi:acyl-CoA N-acyltransferase [Dissophora ornata]|nr:acyl-CoA N-acyltransferase [Dissophora ornata]